MSQKISFKLIFEYLSLGWVFLGVIFYEKTFLFYKIFLVSKQNLEKMAPIWWNICKNIASIWMIQFPSFKKSYYQFLMINLSKIFSWKITPKNTHPKLKYSKMSLREIFFGTPCKFLSIVHLNTLIILAWFNDDKTHWV